MKIIPINILVLGQTGVGKSSLINYLLKDQTLTETSTGFPITEKGFHLKKGTVHQMPIHLYDSWGIENGMLDEWMKTLKTFINKLGRKIDCVWFCINSNSHRIQQTELEVMNYIISKGFEVTVIFTKCAPAQIEEANELRNVIEAEIPVINKFAYINSVGETLMSGEKLVPFGREALVAPLVELAVAKNVAALKEFVKNTLLSLLENKEYTQGELKDYIQGIVADSGGEKEGWLLHAKKAMGEKSARFMKKVDAVKHFVKKPKVDVQRRSEQLARDIDRLLHDPTIEEMLSSALRKELAER